MVIFQGICFGFVVFGARNLERKAKTKIYRLGFDVDLLPFKSATQLQYLPETFHKMRTNFRGQDQLYFLIVQDVFRRIVLAYEDSRILCDRVGGECQIKHVRFRIDMTQSNYPN